MTQEESYSELCAKRKVPLDRTTPSFDNLIRKLNDGYEFEGDERNRAIEDVSKRLEYLIGFADSIRHLKYLSKEEASQFMNVYAFIEYHVENLRDLKSDLVDAVSEIVEDVKVEALKASTLFYRYEAFRQKRADEETVLHELSNLESVVEEYFNMSSEFGSRVDELWYKELPVEFDDDLVSQRDYLNQWANLLESLKPRELNHLLRTTALYLRYAGDTGMASSEAISNMREIHRLTRLYIENDNTAKSILFISPDNARGVNNSLARSRKRAIATSADEDLSPLNRELSSISEEHAKILSGMSDYFQ